MAESKIAGDETSITDKFQLASILTTAYESISAPLDEGLKKISSSLEVLQNILHSSRDSRAHEMTNIVASIISDVNSTSDIISKLLQIDKVMNTYLANLHEESAAIQAAHYQTPLGLPPASVPYSGMIKIGAVTHIDASTHLNQHRLFVSSFSASEASANKRNISTSTSDNNNLHTTPQFTSSGISNVVTGDGDNLDNTTQEKTPVTTNRKGRKRKAKVPDEINTHLDAITSHGR